MVTHEMGKGWSLYLAELYKNLFEEFEVMTTQFETTTDSCVEWPWRRNSRLGKDKPL
jgi:hypothetical protein